MARVRLDDGTIINFDGEPTPDDIEEAIVSLGQERQQSFNDQMKQSFQQDIAPAVNMIKTLGRIGTTSLFKDRLAKSPTIQAAGEISPMLSVAGVPVPSLMVPPMYRKNLFIKDLEGMTSPLGIIATLGLLGRGGLNQAARYPLEKTRAIQGGLRNAQRLASKNYGKMIRSIGKTGESVDPTNFLGAIEQRLIKTGLLDNNLRVLRPAMNKVESKFLTAYRNIFNKFAQSDTGKIPVNDLITESRNVLASGGKPSKFIIVPSSRRTRAISPSQS